MRMYCRHVYKCYEDMSLYHLLSTLRCCHQLYLHFQLLIEVLQQELLLAFSQNQVSRWKDRNDARDRGQSFIDLIRRAVMVVKHWSYFKTGLIFFVHEPS